MVSKRTKFLSHLLSTDTPTYADKKENSLSIHASSTIASGAPSNSAIYSFHGHLGTHLDCPRHFVKDGNTVDQYAADFWYSEEVSLVEVKVEPGLLIASSHLPKDLSPKTEVLLIRTGYEKNRGKEAYWKEGPGIHASLAPWLREHCPKIRFIGFDFISLTSFLHREHGREAHREFLGGESPILIIEDMHLSDISENPRSIIISPLRIQGADGVPVTVFGIY